MEIGKVQKLKVVNKVDFGVYLGEEKDKVLLPKNEVPAGVDVGNEVEVFIMRDSEDRLIATVHQPTAQVGELARMKVQDVTKHGAFLDWGMGKDLFLPYKEQTYKVKPGDEVLAGVYVDKSERLAATMKIYSYLSVNSTHDAEDIVEGTVYNINPEYGVFVAVDDKFHGMIQKKEVVSEMRIGERIKARVKSRRTDGKLDLAMRKKSYMQIDEDAETIYEFMREHGGKLDYTDRAEPARIKQDFAMSKAEFKRAIGRLLKNKRIEIEETGIKLLD